MPLQQLQHLTDLGISLVSGDVPAGQHLPLPSQLQRLQVSATTFSLAINVLPLQQLQHLTSLKLSVMDSGSTKSLPKLLTLTALQHLSLGRFWVVPDVLHNFSSLQSLEVYVYGKVWRTAGWGNLAVLVVLKQGTQSVNVLLSTYSRVLSLSSCPASGLHVTVFMLM